MNTIGDRVRHEREIQGISRKDFAKQTGIGYSTIAELERGGMKTSTQLRVMADALQVNLRWLETGKGPKAAPAQSSQSERLPDETMAQAVELLYLIAEMRPDDKRFTRLTWPMILVAAKAIARAEGQQREVVAAILNELDERK